RPAAVPPILGLSNRACGRPAGLPLPPISGLSNRATTLGRPYDSYIQSLKTYLAPFLLNVRPCVIIPAVRRDAPRAKSPQEIFLPFCSAQPRGTHTSPISRQALGKPVERRC